MYDLCGTVINLRSASITIQAEFLEHDSIYFYYNHESYEYDCCYGVAREFDWDRGAGWKGISNLIDTMVQPEFGYYEPERARRMMLLTDKQWAAEARMRLERKAPKLEAPLLALVASIASQRVSADEMIKGLKAWEFSHLDEFKVQKNYLGGYTIWPTSRDPYYWSVEELCKHLTHHWMDERAGI